MANNLYLELYTLVENVIFGGNAEITAYTEWVTTAIATLGCIALVGLPFYIVYRIIKMICG